MIGADKAAQAASLKGGTRGLEAGKRILGQPRAFGALAQLVARDIRIVEVRGSTPLCSTTKKPLKILHLWS